MKDLFFNALYCLGIAAIFMIIVIVMSGLYSFAKIFLKKIAGPNCKHRMREMTDKVGSPIKCMDCGKVVG